MTLKEAYSYGVQFLEGNHVDEPDFKSLCVVCHLAGIKNSRYQAHINDEIIVSRFAKMLWRLKTGEPLQYVLGKWDFYESEFYVGDGVLIPRPETEELVDLVIKSVQEKNDCVVYDLCAGSGCIGISIAKKCKKSSVYMIEKSSDAFSYLKKNMQNVQNAYAFNGDIQDGFDLPKADIIVSNPPYIRSADMPLLQREVQFEPSMALDGGKDGLDFYRIINDNWSVRLKDDGLLFLEIGNDQGTSIISVLSAFKNINVIKDLYGNDRMVVAEKR